MLNYEELLSEIRRRSHEEKLALLEEMVRALREEITAAPGEDSRQQQWPLGFFEQTYGMFRDDPLERLPQNE